MSPTATTRNCSPDLAVEWANSAWKNLKLSVPVDVHKLRRHVGLYVRMQDLGHASGHLLRTPKRWYVVVNIRDQLERQRFTIAHEVGEFCLKRDRERRGLSPAEGPEKERLCDRFAAHVLMPEHQLRQAAAGVYHSAKNDKTAVLAARFGVSEQAMRIRLRELGLRR